MVEKLFSNVCSITRVLQVQKDVHVHLSTEWLVRYYAHINVYMLPNGTHRLLLFGRGLCGLISRGWVVLVVCALLLYTDREVLKE